MTRQTAILDPLGDPKRPSWKPYTVNDLCLVTGWSRPTVIGAIRAGQLPGHQATPGGKWTIPAQAFRDFCAGTWQPQPREIVITTINPIQSIRRVS